MISERPVPSSGVCKGWNFVSRGKCQLVFYDHCNMLETPGHFIVSINLEVILMSEKWEV